MTDKDATSARNETARALAAQAVRKEQTARVVDPDGWYCDAELDLVFDAIGFDAMVGRIAELERTLQEKAQYSAEYLRESDASTERLIEKLEASEAKVVELHGYRDECERQFQTQVARVADLAARVALAQRIIDAVNDWADPAISDTAFGMPQSLHGLLDEWENGPKEVSK